MKRIEHTSASLSLKRQCELLKINRSRLYRKKQSVKKNDIEIMNVMRDIYIKYPFYGYRKIHVELLRKGYSHNKKKTQRLMKIAGLQSIYPRKKTTIRNKNHAVFPYLLKNLLINRPNQAWGTDITYITIKNGFAYLIALIDIFSRKIMGWHLSTFLDAKSCIEALEKALSVGFVPEIINSDQGCQFTSQRWVSRVQEDGIKISMDGKGRWADNIYIERFWRSVKYEAVYLNSLESVSHARDILGEYITFYNEIRPHQALKYQTPNQVFNCTSFLPKGPTVCHNQYQKSINSNILVQNSLIFDQKLS